MKVFRHTSTAGMLTIETKSGMEIRLFQNNLIGNRFVIETESGTWFQNTKLVEEQEEIVWYQFKDKEINAANAYNVVEAHGPLPMWLQHFLNKYLWMLNDPIAWEHFEHGKTVRVPYPK